MKNSPKGPLFLAAVNTSPGPLCEIGVYQGRTFRLLLEAAIRLGTTAHAIDSFRGMAAPGPRDAGHYGRGQFDIGGVEQFWKLLAAWDLSLAGQCSATFAWPGYVPEVLATLPPDLRFGFVHVDLDHYQPTLDAGRWAWERLLPGGVMAFHDYLPQVNRDKLASAAVDVLRAELDPPWWHVEGDEMLFSRGVGGCKGGEGRS